MPSSGTGPERPHVPFLARFLATGAFTGYSPWASGTVGTAAGILPWLIPGVENPLILGAMIALALPAGALAAGRVAAAEGDRRTPQAEKAKAIFRHGSGHGPDPSIVVIDEIVGMWITLLFLPKTLLAGLAAFVLFRFMDVVKPEPARSLERLPGGWGIMLDDVAAGVYANISCHLLLAGARLLLPGIV